MRAGQLRHRLELQENTPTRNAVGEEVAVWSTIERFYGSIEPLSGREFLNAQASAAEMSHRIRRRYKAGITPDHRIRFGERLFDINVVINIDERSRELEILVKEAI